MDCHLLDAMPLPELMLMDANWTPGNIFQLDFIENAYV